jgi:hypothetical protein
LLLLDDGWTAERAAAVLFINAETVHQHRRLYEADGTTVLNPGVFHRCRAPVLHGASGIWLDRQ